MTTDQVRPQGAAQTPATIVRDLQKENPSFNYDLSACNGSGKFIQQLITQRKIGITNFTAMLKSIQEQDTVLYRKLTETKPGPRGILLSEVQPKEVSWLWQGRLPRGKLVMLDGEPGLGKTTLVFDLIARLTTRRNMPEETGTAQDGGAVIISLEDGLEDTIQPRLDRAGANLERVSFLGFLKEATPEGREFDRPFTLPNDIPFLEEEIKRVNAGIVMIDPIMAILGGKDTYKDNEVRAALAPLKTLAEQYGVTVLMIRHTTKHNNDKLIYAGGGSVAFIGLARVGLIVMKNPDNEEQVILANPKNNLARNAPKLLYHVASEPLEDERPHIVWDGETTISDQELMQPATQVPGQLRQDILRVLKSNYPEAMEPQLIADAVEESNNTNKVKVTLSRMVKDDQIVKSARGLYAAHSGLSHQ